MSSNFLKNKIKLLSERWELYFLLKKYLGIYPRSLSPYQLSIIHRSSLLKDESGEVINNERLEFLGDAILGSVVAEVLYQNFPLLDEGSLTKTRSKIVNRTVLNRIALDMGLDQLVKHQSQISASKTHILGDALEAIIGAVFLDKGYAKCKRFVLNKVIHPHVELAELINLENNFKSLLIEWSQKYKREFEYQTNECGRNQNNTLQFESKVMINGEVFGQGIGKSKKIAQQNAALQALERVTQLDMQLPQEVDLSTEES